MITRIEIFHAFEDSGAHGNWQIRPTCGNQRMWSMRTVATTVSQLRAHVGERTQRCLSGAVPAGWVDRLFRTHLAKRSRQHSPMVDPVNARLACGDAGHQACSCG